MTSDRYIKLRLMMSDVGRWVDQRGSDIESANLDQKVIPKMYLLNFAS